MSKFQVGDWVTPKLAPDLIEIWIHKGKVYKVKDIKYSDPIPASICYRNCGHPIHEGEPSKAFIVLDGERGIEAQILSDCFVLAE